MKKTGKKSQIDLEKLERIIRDGRKIAASLAAAGHPLGAAFVAIITAQTP